VSKANLHLVNLNDEEVFSILRSFETVCLSRGLYKRI